MKPRIEYILIVLITVLMALTSCGKNETREKIYATQEILLNATDTTLVINIDKLYSPITEIQNSAEWLEIEILTYTTGSPQLKVTCLENNLPNKRIISILIKNKEGDEITLIITQNVKSALEDLHNNISDQPALAHKR